MLDKPPTASPLGDPGDRPPRRTDVLAWAICRSYALLPILVTPLLGGVLAWVPGGELWAWVLPALAIGTMAFRFTEVPASWWRTLATFVVHAGALSIPALILPASPWSLLWGFILESAVVTVIIALTSRVPSLSRTLDLPLSPDIFTGAVLIALFYLPVALRSTGARKRPAFAPHQSHAPTVSVILTAYQEESTIRTCVRSIRRGIREARRRLPLGTTRLVLAVNESDRETIWKALEAGVDRVLFCPPGKLQAHHHAMAEDTADIIVAADGDRGYDRQWLFRLLSPLFQDSRVVATLGETRDLGGGLSGSALSRSVLTLPNNGGNAAFYREGYLRIPFDSGVDQFKHRELWLEEEFAFGLRLRELGRVVHVPDSHSCELRPYGLFRVMARHLLGRRLRTF